MKIRSVVILVSGLALSSLLIGCSEAHPDKISSIEAQAEVAKTLAGDGPQAQQSQQANAQSNQ